MTSIIVSCVLCLGFGSAKCYSEMTYTITGKKEKIITVKDDKVYFAGKKVLDLPKSFHF